MGRRRMTVGLVVLLMTALCFAGWCTPAAAQETLKIGAIWGLSGPMSQLGVVCRDGAVIAAEWINGKGGVTVAGKKYKIELVIEDNKNTAAGSVTAATKLVHKDKVKFVTGMNIPFQFEAVQTVTEPAKVILNTGKASNLIPKNRYTFSSTQGFTAPIPYLYETLKKKYPDVKTVGLISNDEAGALIVSKITADIAGKFGYKTMEPALVQFGAKEHYPTWTKLIKDKPDAVDIGISSPDDLAAKARQGRELGFKGPMLTCNTGDSHVFTQLIGKDGATDFIFAGYDPSAPDTPAMVKMIAKMWDQKYKKPFSLDAVDGWSSVWTLVQAIEKAQSFDVEKVVEAWENMPAIETPTGPGKMGGKKVFGINHMVFGPSPVSILKNGKVESTFWYKPADM